METNRLVVAWSKGTRPAQGHIFKIHTRHEHLKTVADTGHYQHCPEIPGGYPAPMPNWEKGVFGLSVDQVHIDGFASWVARSNRP